MSSSRFVVRQAGEGDSLAVGGDVYRMLAEGEDTGQRCFFCHGIVPPGSGSPPHLHHRDTEAFYVLKGTVTFHLLDEESRVAVGPGGFVHLPEGRPHRFSNEGQETAEILVWASSPALGQMFRAAGTPSSIPISPTEQHIGELIRLAPEYGMTLLI